MKRLYFFVLTSFLIISFANAQDESDIIEEVQDLYEDIEYLSAEFTQIETFHLTGSENIAKGKIYIKDGVEYRLETEEHIIVTDGKVVWSYSPLKNKLIIDKVKEGDASMLPRDILFRYPKNHLSNLIGEEKIGDKNFYVIKMTPKQDVQGYIKSIKIWVDKETYLIHKMEYNDLNDNTSSFKIEQLDVKTKLPESLFKFEPPANAELIDMR